MSTRSKKKNSGPAAPTDTGNSNGPAPVPLHVLEEDASAVGVNEGEGATIPSARPPSAAAGPSAGPPAGVVCSSASSDAPVQSTAAIEAGKDTPALLLSVVQPGAQGQADGPPAPLGSPIVLDSNNPPVTTSSDVVPPSTPKKRKLSDAADHPSTPPSARSSKSSSKGDSPYRKRTGGSASIVGATPSLAVRAVIPLTHGYRKDLTDVTIDRLNVAVNLYRPNQGYYSVSKLPSLLTWGPGNGSSLPTDNSRYITEASSSRTRVLIIGEVTKAFLRGTETNRGSCSINVAPLFTADAERLADLVQGFSTSSKVKVSAADIASAGVMISNSIGVENTFEDIYDARERFGNKADMDELKAGVIVPGVIVCVEANIQRYVHYEDHNRPRDGWLWSAVPYRIGLQLRAISLIATPRDVVDDDDVEF